MSGPKKCDCPCHQVNKGWSSCSACECYPRSVQGTRRRVEDAINASKTDAPWTEAELSEMYDDHGVTNDAD